MLLSVMSDTWRQAVVVYAGRIDDEINVSGHRIGTAEVEAALARNAQCAEAAVVGAPHRIKGQSIYAFVVVHSSVKQSDALRMQLIECDQASSWQSRTADNAGIIPHTWHYTTQCTICNLLALCAPVRAAVVLCARRADSLFCTHKHGHMCRDVRKSIGAFAAPDAIHWAPGLPKTRSGKVMRRILRKIASGELVQLGDTSTLADPSVVEALCTSMPGRGKLE